jgi:cellobiose transport system substrate-binding protein
VLFKRIAYVASTLALSLGLIACSSSNESGGTESTTDSSNASSGENVELTMWAFPGMGLDEQIKKYQEENPNVTIKLQETPYGDHHQNLVTALASGSGAPDVAVIESEYIERLKENQNQFHNLKDYGADDIAGDYLEWRWREASSVDGSFVLGIPTDVGPMAMAYRVDIFEEAGLPTDPDEVSEALGTWEEYIEAGRQIKEATGGYMFNFASDMFRVVRDQGQEQYFDMEGNFILEESEQIKRAWDLAVEAQDISANIERESTEWGAAVARGDFATVFLPPWMLQQIKDNAPETEGLWNVTQIPEASGNWGGSLLSIPAQSKNAEEAYEFIAWLNAPEQQLEIFKERGNFPSTPSVYDNEELQSFSDPFFTRDDLGSMLAEAAERVEYVYRSPETRALNIIMRDAVASIEDGTATAEQAWNTAVEEAKRQISR